MSQSSSGAKSVTLATCAFPKGKPASWSLRNAPQQQHIPGAPALSPQPGRKNICNWGEIKPAVILEAGVWGGTEDNQEETGGKRETQQLMTFQKPERWQSEGFPALRSSLSPSAPWQSCRQCTFSPLLAASERETAGGLGKVRARRGQLIHPVSFSLSGKRWVASPAANSRAPPPSRQHQTKYKADQVVTLPLDHQASYVVCLKGIFPRNKTLRSLSLGCLAARCCHVFMAIAACGRWDPKWRQLWGYKTFVAQTGVGFCYPASNGVACPLISL